MCLISTNIYLKNKKRKDGIIVKKKKKKERNISESETNTHLHWQDVNVETNEPAGDHEGPRDTVVRHGLPHSGDFQPH